MKKFTLLLMIVLGAFTGRTNAQSDTLDVPPLTDGQPTALNKFIQDDTDAPEGRVYRLQRGAKYLFNQTCEINRSLRITSETEPESTIPAMIVASPDPDDGSLTELWFLLTGSDIDVDISNVFFQGVRPPQEGLDPAQQYTGAWLFYCTGDTIRLKHDNVIFNGFGGGVDNITNAAKTVTFEVTNCIYRNIQFQNHPFMGQSLSNDATHTQVMIVKNNTFFNANSYIVFTHYLCDSLVIEHNTFFGNTLQPLWTYWATNMTVKDNIFYAMQSFGLPKVADDEGWMRGFDGDTLPAIINLQKDLPSELGVKESGRKVVVTNNAYYVPKAIDDFWQEAIDNGWDSLCIRKPVWINPHTQEMFDDNENYPALEIANNYTDKDPGFRQGIVDTIASQRIDFDIEFSKYVWEMPATKTYHYAPNGDIFNVPWPLPEDLSYTNADLLTASSTGGPLGDPRWFGGSTGVRSMKYQHLHLIQNYPNPFSDYTDITFDVEHAGRAVLKIYNIQGQLIKTLIDKKYTPGTYTVRFEAGDLPAGIYFYRLKLNGKVGTRRMILQR